ncbi:MAG TPA: response regulator transcription factor [Anaerolineae bacterium]|nr:response regulator transcription factor [Anaerolineae bacterium]HOQ98372.1 response regulator transcription factor [Anaerolineae bacterium]HPL28684.1 response regulator transcription factor [Anaerolineae bacterium]
MDKARILIAEDEPQMMGILAFALESEGWAVLTAYDGQQALDKVVAELPDLLLLDVMLPRVDGLEICRRVRESTTIPVILLTAKREEEDIIRGLELGADDYITKPFRPRELVLRIQAVLRRSGVGKAQAIVEVGALRVDGLRYQATLAGAPLELTATEFRLLSCLAANAGRAVSWQALLKHAWGLENWEGGKEMVKTAIYRLRQKVERDPNDPRLILNVRSVGYTMPSPEESGDQTATPL